MSGCDYCEALAKMQCEVCGSWVCPQHAVVVGKGRKYEEALCNPDPATNPGRGCYKPPVSEVRDGS